MEVLRLQWDYANRYSELSDADAMKVEAMVKIAEQLALIADRLDSIAQKDDTHVTVRGCINTT